MGSRTAGEVSKSSGAGVLGPSGTLSPEEQAAIPGFGSKRKTPSGLVPNRSDGPTRHVVH